jgi:carboxyl-terminal processing protease
VQLVIIRTRNTEPTKLSLTRGVLETPPIQAKVLEPEIGYLKIPTFYKGVSEEASSKLRMLLSGKLAGLVLDLRGSSFGEYDEAMKIADVFLPAGKLMASLKDRKQKVKDYISTGNSVDSSVPLVVLTSVGTAGPAELLTAALKDNSRAQIVGEKTSGTASLQQTLELEDGSLLILTTQLFYTPGGSTLDNKNPRKAGIQPNEKVPDESFITNFYYQNPSLTDYGVIPGKRQSQTADEQYARLIAEIDKLQLQKAIELLRKAGLKKAA